MLSDRLVDVVGKRGRAIVEIFRLRIGSSSAAATDFGGLGVGGGFVNLARQADLKPGLTDLNVWSHVFRSAAIRLF